MDQWFCWSYYSGFCFLVPSFYSSPSYPSCRFDVKQSERFFIKIAFILYLPNLDQCCVLFGLNHLFFYHHLFYYILCAFFVLVFRDNEKEQDKTERAEKADKAERQKLRREKEESETKLKQREAVQQHFEDSLCSANQKVSILNNLPLPANYTCSPFLFFLSSTLPVRLCTCT